MDTFLLFFIILSAFVSIIFIIFLFQIDNYFENGSIGDIVCGVSILLVIICAGLVLFDFLTLGGLKRIKGGWFPKVYLFIYRFFSIVSLSAIYRPLLYNFLDDKYT